MNNLLVKRYLIVCSEKQDRGVALQAAMMDARGLRLRSVGGISEAVNYAQQIMPHLIIRTRF